MVRKMMLSWMVTLMLLHSPLIHGLEISVTNGGQWGKWGWMDTCPSGMVATGFDLRVEPPQGGDDDTALNAIKLYCNKPGEKDLSFGRTSLAGRWGSWTGVQWCPSGYLDYFVLQVEEPLGSGDDTAANNVLFHCSDFTVLPGSAGKWGSYGRPSATCQKGICGIVTKVEDPQGRGDDTALNDVKFQCC